MSLEELEKRLRTLEDIEEIKQLQARYVDCLTKIDWDGLVDCFAENGVVDLSEGAKGKEEIAKFYKEEIALTHIGMEGVMYFIPLSRLMGTKLRVAGFYTPCFPSLIKSRLGQRPLPTRMPRIGCKDIMKWNMSEKMVSGKLVF